MKIGLVIDDTLDTSDGVQQYVLLLGGWLQKQGHEVHYLTGHSTRTDLAHLHSLAKNIKVAFNKNVLSVPLPASSANLRQLLTKEQFDVLHIQMPFSPFLAGKLIKFAPSSTAIVSTFHVAPHNRSVIIGSRLLASVQRKNLQRIDRVISVSSVAKDFAESSHNIDSQVIPNAIDLKLWQPKVRKDPDYDVVFLGRLVPRKGCIYLLQAIHKLHTERPSQKLKLAIIGDGPERSKLENYVENHGLSSICTFKGFVSETEKRSILQSSKLAVFPATGGESFGIVLIEAMAAGSVVIAGNNPGYETVLGKIPKTLFSPQDGAQFSNLIESLLEDESFYNQIREKQQKLVQQYDIDIVGSDILEMYQQLVKQKNNV